MLRFAAAAPDMTQTSASALLAPVAEDLQRVFEPFYRGTGPQGRLGAGTGLGLAICRAFVEANRGSVAALSAGLGQGTTVRITLPA